MEREEKGRARRIQRGFTVQTREAEAGDDIKELWVEGCAVRFDSPTVLFELGGTEYKEQIDSRAFEECDMSDVIFNYNHSGKVMARTRNGTLRLEVREDGLYIGARLDGTEEGRRLYDEIRGGYIDRMSFQFTIREESYDKINHLWTVRKVKRLYDVSAVDIPAYDDTSIEARKKFLEEEIFEEAAGRDRKDAEDRRKRRLKLKILLGRKRAC